jgi:sensor histidine kinase YesM
MKKIKDWKNAEKLIYWVIWGVIFCSPLIFGDFSDLSQRHLIIRGWIRILPLFIIFLIHNLYLLPQLIFRGKTNIYFLTAIVLLFGINYLFLYNDFIRSFYPHITNIPHLRPFPGQGHGPGGKPMRLFFSPYLEYIYSVVLSILILGFNAALKYTSKWISEEEKRKEAEKENLQSKLNTLQQQVSPHFFMNTLNNIHALIDYNKDDAKDAIVRLSKMMRYLLYDSGQGKTTFIKEIEFLNSYIDLMKLRITDEIELKVDFLSSPPDLLMPPLLFITFVENAFKYGVSYKEKSFIYMMMELKADKIHFNIKNSKFLRDTDKTGLSGIGIANTRKRLDLIYHSNYLLEISDGESEFEVDLIIPATINL